MFPVIPFIPELIGRGLVFIAAAYKAYKKIKEFFNNNIEFKYSIVGMTGAGKTTLFDIITHDERAKNGATPANGETVKGFSTAFNGKEYIFRKTKDYYGDKDSAKYFEALFEDTNFIVFVFDFERFKINNGVDYSCSYQALFSRKLNAACTAAKTVKSREKKNLKDTMFVILGSHTDKISSFDKKNAEKDLIAFLKEEDFFDSVSKFNYSFVFGDLTDDKWQKEFLSTYVFRK